MDKIPIIVDFAYDRTLFAMANSNIEIKERTAVTS